MAGFAEVHARLKTRSMARLDKIIIGGIEELGELTIARTPIDTGRAQSNWRVQAGAADITTTDETNARTLHGLDSLPARGAHAFTFYLTNSLRYAPKLERGWSDQAPQGMVRRTSGEWPRIVADVARKIPE